eukprot:CAMPEP_0181466146 /NCGR_PEP_ID=MMETSP1110-20121109/36314_1 /TAXON_ID=174948 /ORGANISM="Symbiodinium sp., Strain CCMP421" /LENGTH=51 /DNA_ID=CAMNT_0023590935 /DNA_START=806 /DNA_END=961 /DNA_ORIENTATION=+
MTPIASTAPMKECSAMMPETMPASASRHGPVDSRSLAPAALRSAGSAAWAA